MIDQQKKEIRKLIKQKKLEYSLEEKKQKSKIIFNQVEEIPEFRNSKVIMAYWSMPDEVYTHDFVLKHFGNKEIILPVVKGDVLELRRFTGMNNMIKGESFGIEEPVDNEFLLEDKIEIIIVPGVAFDNNNNRLGRGKAYYDKLLKKSQALKIGVCFDFQLLEQVPVDQYDVKLDMVISD